MSETTGQADQQRANEDIFDDMIDKICAPPSRWSYEEAVHLASDMWDEQGYPGPRPSDYVPRERRRRLTGGA